MESGILSFLPFIFYLLLRILAKEVIQHAGELHREDELGGRAGTNGLERFKILQGHGLLINSLAALKMASRATAKPSARKACACFSPSARRMLDCVRHQLAKWRLAWYLQRG